MDYEEFFHRFIDGYLLSDIKRLNELEMIDGPGNCGYMMLQAILSGYDLLGGLICDSWKPIPDPSSKYFYDFIARYLDHDSNYAKARFILWESIRNKLAHTYLTRDFIDVHKEVGPGAIVRRGNRVKIYCANLASDFAQAVAKLEHDISRDLEMQRVVENNIKLMMNFLALDMSRDRDALTIAMEDIHEKVSKLDHRASGPSIAFMPPSGVAASATLMPTEEFEVQPKKRKPKF